MNSQSSSVDNAKASLAIGDNLEILAFGLISAIRDALTLGYCHGSRVTSIRRRPEMIQHRGARANITVGVGIDIPLNQHRQGWGGGSHLP